MESYLTALRTKRAAVQVAINAEYARPFPDPLVLAGLKKRKLRLRDAIERIESRSSLMRFAPPRPAIVPARPL